MQTPETITPSPKIELDQAENSFFGNPYQLRHEQYGLEYLDRNNSSADEIERVVILGYN